MALSFPRSARVFKRLNPARLSAQGRILSAGLVILAGVLVLIVHQAAVIARQDAGEALEIQATAQLAALAQVVTDAAIARDYSAAHAHLQIPVEQGHLLMAEFVAPNGMVFRAAGEPRQATHPGWFDLLGDLRHIRLEQTLVVGGAHYGRLAIQPSPVAYENFLWHLGTRLVFVIVAAFVLLGWLTRQLLSVSLKDLDRLSHAVRAIETGDYSARLPIRQASPPELQETARAFNLMSVALERLLTDLNEQQKALDSAASVSESDLAGHIILTNELFCILSGYTREELLGRNHRMLNSGWHEPEFFARLWQTISDGHTWRGEICNRAKDGRLFWIATTIIPVKGDDGLPQKYLSICFDITQRKLDQAAISAEKERWHVTLQSISDAVIVTNAADQVTYLNPAAENLLDTPLADAQSQSLNHLVQLDSMTGQNNAPACYVSSATSLKGRTGSAQLRTRTGLDLAISYSCASLPGSGGVGAVYVLRDETEKKQLLDSLRDMAFHDALTGLPNRRAVEGRLSRALRMTREQSQHHAFCYIDLDQFKLVNDTCGHSVGDGLLMQIARTMQDNLPENAYLGRLGGDEFGLILFDTTPAKANRICRELVQRIREFRFEHKGRRFTLGACAGIAPITQADTTAGEIMIQADMACYRAKSEGSGRVMLYEADEVGFRRLEAEMGWAADFAQALEGNQFLPYRQLIQATSAHGQPHYEVLIRWQRNGVIEGPAKLLPALERYGQAPILDRWMIEAVVSYLAKRPDDHAVYFINLSGKTVADESFLATLCQLLDRYGVEGERLGFEITETAAVVNLDEAQRLIKGLRERGCQVALDDFGRDASSFFYLKHLAADFLKIDGAFVRGMLSDRRDQAIVRSIAQLARDFGMQSVAEQVEDAEMAAMLGEIGVDYLQGYHVHRPEALPDWQPVCAQEPAPPPPHLKIVG